MKRFAQVIHLKPEHEALYRELHAQPWKSVTDRISACNIKNYSIYLFRDLLFSYFEYVGEDFAADMKKMAEDEETQRWWKLTDPCQEKVSETTENEWWHIIEEVFHNE